MHYVTLCGLETGLSGFVMFGQPEISDRRLNKRDVVQDMGRVGSTALPSCTGPAVAPASL